MAEAHETHEVASEIQEHGGSHRWRNRTAIYIGILAMLLAITGLGGADATKMMTNENIHASDTYAFYQAKNIRQTDYRIAADQLELLISLFPGHASEADFKKKVADYRKTAERYESEPGEGKKDLLAKAKAYEQMRDHAAAQDPYFDFAAAFFQIGIVLASVSIVAESLALLLVSFGLGGVATLLMLNGFFLVADILHH